MMADTQEQTNVIKRAFRLLVLSDVPVILWGPPGVGKSTAVRDLATELRWPLYEIIPAIREPADFGGYPVPDGEIVRLRPVGGWHDFARAVVAAGNGLLLLDEIPAATVSIQNALLRVVLDRVVGEFVLPPGVHVVCAGNPPDQSAGGWDLSAAFANRLAHLVWPTPTVAQWVAWLMRQPLPKDERLADAMTYARHLVSAFLAAQPGLLLGLPPGDAERSLAWASPRSWASCTKVLGYVVAAGTKQTAFIEMGAAVAAATVGPAAAASFVDVLRGMELIDPEELLANPALWDERVACGKGDGKQMVRAWSALVAVAAAVLSNQRVRGRVTKARWDAAWEVHRRARLSTIDGGYLAGAAVAALGIPLSVAALPPMEGHPAGPAYGLPPNDEEAAATELRTRAMT
jgi:hypothetical protein